MTEKEQELKNALTYKLINLADTKQELLDELKKVDAKMSHTLHQIKTVIEHES